VETGGRQHRALPLRLGHHLVEHRAEALQLSLDEQDKRLKALESGPKPLVQEKGKAEPWTGETGKPTRPVRPKEADFDDIETYEKAMSDYETALDQFHEDLADWKVGEALRKERETVEAQRIQAAEAKRQAEDEAKIVAGIAQYEDFEQVAIKNGLPYTDDMAATIFESENFVELAYYLGKNPAEVRRIAALSPINQVRELTRLEIDLQAKAKPDSNNESPGKTKPGLKRSTTAEEPISPVTAAGTTDIYDPDKADPRTYFKHRDAEEIKQKRRGL